MVRIIWCALVLAACGDGSGGPVDASAPSLDGTASDAPVRAGMAWIEGGTFDLGCDEEEPGCSVHYTPRRTATVSSFWLDIDEAVGADGSPSRLLSVADARAACASLEKRLPTRDEWELAARGPALRRYPWGDDGLDCDHAMFMSCGDGPLPPGQLLAGTSPEGVHDLVGNVAEWADIPGETYIPAMGGSYKTSSEYLAGFNAFSDEDGIFVGVPDVGYRCAADLE